MPLFCGLAVTLLLIAGCGDSARSLVDKNRAALEARVKAVEEFARKVDGGTASTAELDFPGEGKLIYISGSSEGNTTRMHVEYGLGREPKFEFEYGEGGALRQVRGLLAEASDADDTDTARSNIDKVLKPRYLLLVKVDKFELPKGDTDGTFTPGSVEFRVHGFDMVEGKDLGQAKCKAENSEKVSVRGKSVSNDQLKSDLVQNAGFAFKKAHKNL